jgi:hypothetical protein
VTERREHAPVVVGCRACDSRWVACYLPRPWGLPVETFVAALEAAKCPTCGATGDGLVVDQSRDGLVRALGGPLPDLPAEAPVTKLAVAKLPAPGRLSFGRTVVHIIGEAGEAILPLKRTPGGELDTATPSIVCPQCRRRSYSPGDIEHRFCVRCGWHADLVGKGGRG